MKKLLPALLFIGLAACNSEQKPANAPVVAAASEPSKAATAKAAPDSATQAKNWMNYMTPGAEQKMLAESDGTWDADVSMWQTANSAEEKAAMTTKNKMILGGRYQQSISTGKMMGMNFEGISTLAFDNHLKKYLSTWIDNMGTGLMYMEGTWDDATKSVNFSGKMVDPATGDEKSVRETFTILDKDHQLMQMYCTGADGKEFRNMQIHYRRKK